jgi:D-alanine-D-alanine ligase
MSETADSSRPSERPEGLDIVILAGGISHERDVSLRSGRRAADALAALGHRITVLDADAALLPTLTALNPDVVWPVLHGAIGEDGALLTLLETTGIPMVGPVGTAAALAWSKPTAKELVARAGIATPRSASLSRETFRDLGANNVLTSVIASLGTPLVVKPAHGGSAQGVSIVTEADQLPRAMVDAYTYADVALIEQRITGTELGVTVINTGNGPVALPAVEIVPREGVYSFEARYNAGETLFYAPARVDASVSTVAAETAVAVHELLGLRQLSRVDLIVDADGTVWFLEANTLPGLTETSLVPQAIAAAGENLGQVYDAIVRAAQ